MLDRNSCDLLPTCTHATTFSNEHGGELPSFPPFPSPPFYPLRLRFLRPFPFPYSRFSLLHPIPVCPFLFIPFPYPSSSRLPSLRSLTTPTCELEAVGINVDGNDNDPYSRGKYCCRLALDCRPILYILVLRSMPTLSGGSVAEWLACWTQAQKGPGSNRSRDAANCSRPSCLCSISSKIGSSPLKDCEGNCGSGGK